MAVWPCWSGKPWTLMVEISSGEHALHRDWWHHLFPSPANIPFQLQHHGEVLSLGGMPFLATPEFSWSGGVTIARNGIPLRCSSDSPRMTMAGSTWGPFERFLAMPPKTLPPKSFCERQIQTEIIMKSSIPSISSTKLTPFAIFNLPRKKRCQGLYLSFLLQKLEA